MSNNNNPPNRQYYMPPEETGYADPLGNCNDFNLLNFINSGEETPVDSPAMDSQRYLHTDQSTSRIVRQQPLYYNPVVTIPQQIPNQALKPSPGSEYQASNSTYSGPSSSNGNRTSPNGEISPHLIAVQQIQQHFPQQYVLEDIPQENLPLELYLNGNEDLSDLQLNDFAVPINMQQQTILGQKRRRMEPVDDIKCEEVFTMANGMNNNQCLLSNSSTNSSINNENINLDYQMDDDGPQRMIKFSNFQPQQWSPLFDAQQTQLPLIQVSIVADKGFSYSNSISCFVNQKKNHLQLTMMLKTGSEQMPRYVYSNETGLKEINQFKVDICGIKAEMPSSEIQMRQSLSNRKTVPFAPEVIEIDPLNHVKKTCQRLHLSDVTGNNNRKNNKQINPAQRYFHLVVKLIAECTDGTIALIQAHASDRFICRASNPKTFEEPQAPTSDTTWQRSNNNAIYYTGPVAIGKDRPVGEAQLTVYGNIVSTGQNTRPSDRRVKEDIIDIDTKEAMERINQLRLVEYAYKPEIAAQWGMSEEERHRVGVIAQELAEVIPDAVRDDGQFLTVDDTRIFYDSVAAQQHLHKISGNMGAKVDNVEEVTVKLAKYMRKYQKVGSMASGLSDISALLAKQTQIDAEKARKEACDNCQDNKSFLSQSSFGASQIGSASQYGRYYSRKGRLSSRESNLCNSRLTQATMVGLVVVMSICLIAMCSLYVMDWYNRTYVYAHTQFPRPDPMHEIANIVELTNWIPPTQPLVRPLLSGCVGSMGSKCPVYCCGSEIPPTTTVPSLNSTDDETETFLKQLLDGDNSSPKPFHEVQIQLVDMNIFLDAKYCVGTSCNPRKGRYNLYIPMSAYLPSIPLHVKFTADSDMQIDSCGQYAKLEPKSCRVGTDKEIGMVPSIHKVNDNIFELSAGKFRQSAYRFRVGHTSDACSMPDEQQGRSFDEYNLIFYRKCVL